MRSQVTRRSSTVIWFSIAAGRFSVGGLLSVILLLLDGKQQHPCIMKSINIKSRAMHRFSFILNIIMFSYFHSFSFTAPLGYFHLLVGGGVKAGCALPPTFFQCRLPFNKISARPSPSASPRVRPPLPQQISGPPRLQLTFCQAPPP